VTFPILRRVTWQLYVSEFPQGSGMHLVRSYRLLYVLVPQVATNLIFPYSGRVFTPLTPILQSIDSGGVRREVASEDGGKKLTEYLSFLIC